MNEEERAELTDEIDHQILMHRDAHFGGDFKVMLTYYQDEGLGVNPEFELERIGYLAQIEEQMGENLAPHILSMPEAEAVAESRRLYEQFKEIYDNEEEEKSPFPRLLADLILTEEEEPEEEIAAIVAHGSKIVPELLDLVKSEAWYNSLYPGYGYGPAFAIECLGRIGDPAAIIPLFERLGKEMVFEEEIILVALGRIGPPAQTFLCKQLKGRPLTGDTVNAAFALTTFGNVREVSLACLEQLRDPEVRAKPLLRSYLLFNCEGLRGSPELKELETYAHDETLPSDLRDDIVQLLKEWQ